MAFQQIIIRGSRAQGTHVSPGQQLPEGATRVLIRLDADWAQGDGNCLLGVESSTDGNDPWSHIASVSTDGGMRDKDGNLPTLTLMNLDTALWYRVFATLAQRTNLGVTIEFT